MTHQGYGFLKHTTPMKTMEEYGNGMVVKAIWQIDNGKTAPQSVVETLEKRTIKEEKK